MGGAAQTALRAELMANAIVTAHNHVLRSWLRGEVPAEQVEADFDRAMSHVLGLYAPIASPTGDGGDASLVVLHTTRSLEELMPALRELAGPTRTVLRD